MAEELTTLSLERYAPAAKALVAAAQALADQRRHPEVLPLHLLACALERGRASRAVFERALPNALELELGCERALSLLPVGKERSYLADPTLDLLTRAERDAANERVTQVGVPNLLNALSQEVRGPAGELLSAFGVVPGSLRRHGQGLEREAAPEGDDSAGAPGLVRRLSSSQAWDRDPVIGRSSELRRLVTILERRQKNCPLLVGEPGVGKRALVRALALRIAAGDVPPRLAASELFELSAAAISSGARLRGELEGKLRSAIAALPRDAVLVVAGLEQFVVQSPALGSVVADALRSALPLAGFRVLATITPDGRQKLADRDPILLRSFSEIAVEEPSVAQAVEMLRGIAPRLERHHDVIVADRALETAATLARRYLQDRRLPEVAIDLLDEAAASKRVEHDGVPAELDRELYRIESLRAQLTSLEGERETKAAELRLRLADEFERLSPRVTAARAALEARRGLRAAVAAIRLELAALEAERERRAVAKDAARVAEIDHATLPELRQRLEKAEAARLAAEPGPGMAELSGEEVAATLAAWTGIPVDKMLEAEAAKLSHMEERLAERIVGQPHALRAVAGAVRRSRVGLRDERRPIGSFLLLGPSGVGKTELAKALAEFLFDDETALTRLDMSEFMERHMAQRLIGAPPGYADSEQGGFLTEAVRKRPYSVLLFDEVEKAHQDVFNLLLQLLDDGRLTDGRGRLTDFSNTVVVLTSNLGAERILEADAALFDSDEGQRELGQRMLERLGQFFRPEFLNRLDDTIVFRPLERSTLRQILELRLRELERKLAARHLTLEVSEQAKQRLVELSYDPALGARPLKRTLLKELQDPLASALLGAELRAGTRVRVTLAADRIEVLIEPPAGELRAPNSSS